jgi:hypothetical protein
LRRSLLLPIVVAAAAYVVIGYSAGTRWGDSGDPAAFITPGQRFLAPELLPPGTPVAGPTGYDGQFFFYLAQDPLLTGKAARRDEQTSPHIDQVGYRYQRIMLPVLGWLASWGHPRVLEWTLPLINLAAVLGSGLLLARFLASRGRSPWWALVYMLSIPVAIGVVRDLSDPLAVSFLVAGVVWWLEGRTLPAVVALAACPLTREVYIIPVATIALIELIRGRRAALPWLVPVAVFAAWQVYVRLALEASVTKGVDQPSAVPLVGAARKLREVLRTDWIGGANWEVLFLALMLLTPLYLLVRSLGLLRRLRTLGERPSRDQLVFVVGFAAVAILPFLTHKLLLDVLSYTRVSAALGGVLVLAYAVSRDTTARLLMIALVGLSLTNPVVALLPTSRSEAIFDPSAR